MNSAYNVEFVYLILLGINAHIDDYAIGTKKIKIVNEGKNTKIKFIDIPIENRRKWDFNIEGQIARGASFND